MDTVSRLSPPNQSDSSSLPRDAQNERGVTARALMLGLLLAAGLAGLNCWIATVYNVHFLGGIQMPFGSVFALLFLVLAVRLPLRKLHQKAAVTQRIVAPLSAVELLTIYSMLIFAGMISTPGTHNMFLTTGPSLFYFATPENRWANLFYNHVPAWLAPGWDGHTYQKEVVEPLFLGGVPLADIPWHAWLVMLIAWSVLLLLSYAVLFFVALMFRRQWTQSEALTFPLLQLPLQMVEVEPSGGESTPFWSNRLMWAGFALAFVLHFLKGMNAHSPDWPKFPLQEAVLMNFTEQPWSAMGSIGAEVHLGGIGLAFLLTREMSFSFWFFFLVQKFEMALAPMLGMPEVGLLKDTYQGRPTFITFQSIGGWIAFAAILIWTARHYLMSLLRAAWRSDGSTQQGMEDEPFSPRFMMLGFVLSFGALLAWSCFAGINIWMAAAFFGIYLLSSLVLTRAVIEGGFLFSQLTFAPLEWMTTGMFGAATVGAGDLTRLSFLNATLMRDARTNILPGFLHTMKIAQELHLDRQGLRRLLIGVAAAIVVTLIVTIWISITALYTRGALTTYSFLYQGPQNVLNGAATMITAQPGFSAANGFWMGVGATVVWLLTLARSRLLWFPLHPIGYIMSSSAAVSRWWFSYFVGWLIKSLLMKYGGHESYRMVRPFMIGLILGNLTAMVGWMLIGFYTATQIPYWPA
ncbi:MAG TPA: DUF6785 family protein [Abditibacteriaceae bacterium]|nr:DUF6785 family protein [Abditibacteriaceae bacterium]